MDKIIKTNENGISLENKLDSNLRLLNLKLKSMLINKRNGKNSINMTNPDQINEKLNQLYEQINSNNMSASKSCSNVAKRRKKFSRTLIIYFIILFMVYYNFSYFKMYVIYFLRLMILSVS